MGEKPEITSKVCLSRIIQLRKTGVPITESEQLIKIAVILETTVSELCGTQIDTKV